VADCATAGRSEAPGAFASQAAAGASTAVATRDIRRALGPLLLIKEDIRAKTRKHIDKKPGNIAGRAWKSENQEAIVCGALPTPQFAPHNLIAPL
jgi:hypothetical protein